MTHEDVARQVPQMVGESLGKAVENNDQRFIEDLGADSLDVVELTMAFEEHFDVTISDDEMESVDTVGKAIELIQRKI